jgi:biotin synthase-like enzyme
MSAVIQSHYSREDVLGLMNLPFPELMHRAGEVHREHFDPKHVQVSTLLSIKTGGCPEDCAYCPQSARYNTGLIALKSLKKPRRQKMPAPPDFAWAQLGVRQKIKMWPMWPQWWAR